MRLHEFRHDKLLAERASRILAMEMMRGMITVLREEAPHNFQTPAFGIPSGDREMYLGKIDGYNLCLNNLESMGTLIEEESQQVPVTFENPDAPEPQEKE